ncbi:single-stranded DNA-binding protein [Rhodopirellula sp. MGV]|uniref:single-stranded DNA-binding protein n=1 Tax=Rhodopirellula sp. MGV TaxID=2023130 RepID=UPI000B971BE1|nr:single-stranded DNA-binding protein [Rhodopirellula sp. MGV]OYP34727.1 single-stranded DNA-binding protein [Rhodopirellula sp. MGV]PNY34318.1 single-stranded DNA-binding protein [Rhodopirellula baltica]
MASFNRVILVGNLTRDIELRYIPSGQAVSDVTIAVNDRRKTASGDWVEEACFVDVTLWGRNAEVASEYLSKGSPVLIEGRLKLDRWETDGQKRSKLRVICEKMQMLGGRTGAGGPAGSSRQSTAEYESDYDSPPPQYQQRGAGARDAQPTGGGAGYEDPNIPF